MKSEREKKLDTRFNRIDFMIRINVLGIIIILIVTQFI